MEMWAQNQQKLNQNSNTTAHSVNAGNKFQGRNHNVNNQPARKDFTRYPTAHSILESALIVAKTGVMSTVNQINNLPKKQ